MHTNRFGAPIVMGPLRHRQTSLIAVDFNRHRISSNYLLEESLDPFLPSWLVRLDAPVSSRDPLGLQGHSQDHADDLLPGLNVFTSRARYYSFLCWAIREAQLGTSPRMHLVRVQRLERLLVLCEALRHETEPDACSYVGRRRGRRYVGEQSGAAMWALPTRILKNQTTNGALRLYRTSLANLELVEEDDVADGLGLRLTTRGDQLADQYRIDSAVTNWALEETDQRKRRDTLVGASERTCLSAKMTGLERRYLLRALFADSASSIQQRETVRLLFEHGLLAPAPVGEEIAAEDADAVSEDGGNAAALAQTWGNWSVVRGVLDMQTTPSLRSLHIPAAFQLAQIGLNAIFCSLLNPTTERGRLSLVSWKRGVAERAGGVFSSGEATSWVGKRRASEIANDLIADERAWPEAGALGIELLMTLALDKQLSSWLGDDHGPLSDRILMLARDGARASASTLIEQLIVDLVAHHHDVSARKGKGEWIGIENGDAVRGDPRPMRPMLHALRFAQLRQLASDLNLRPEDVDDET